ncbi:dienelactone hydrolase family protein [Archangium violaceum]|uniref:dienelactone hydrolase family protein n=1 Tax=Archangium violaceum TaxID=83451 RepID=UPI00194FD8CB|nr:dienelactone hydrolase family protein [Archangium violaceum]QRN98427.1 dienelactone hydrolase family protein [Archangium violaceum]
MTEQAKLTSADGTELPGYLTRAQGGTNRGAVVVIHEWWGLTEQLRGVADRLAREGFTVFAPDLYRGRVTKDAAEAEKLMGAMDRRQAVQDISRAVEALRRHAPGTKVAVLGFCMGGALTLAAAAHDGQVAAAVPFYGIPPEEAADVTKIRCPVLGHYANIDDWCSPDRVDALEKKLKGAGVPAEIHRYDAGHAFFNEKRPEVYSPQNAELAWKRTVEFLRAKLG